MTDESYEDIIRDGLSEDRKGREQRAVAVAEADKEREQLAQAPRWAFYALSMMALLSLVIFLADPWSSDSIPVVTGPPATQVQQQLLAPLAEAPTEISNSSGIEALRLIIEDNTKRLQGLSTIPPHRLIAEVESLQSKQSAIEQTE